MFKNPVLPRSQPRFGSQRIHTPRSAAAATTAPSDCPAIVKLINPVRLGGVNTVTPAQPGQHRHVAGARAGADFVTACRRA